MRARQSKIENLAGSHNAAFSLGLKYKNSGYFFLLRVLTFSKRQICDAHHIFQDIFRHSVGQWDLRSVRQGYDLPDLLIFMSATCLYISSASYKPITVRTSKLVAVANGWRKFVSMQNYLNLVYREEEREMIPLCLDQGVGLMPWSPMARGRLTRPHGQQTERTKTDVSGQSFYRATEVEDGRVIDVVEQVAGERGVPMAQIALAWVLAKRGVSAPIVGASKVPQLDDAIAALELVLTNDEIKRLEAPYVPHAVTGFS